MKKQFVQLAAVGALVVAPLALSAQGGGVGARRQQNIPPAGQRGQQPEQRLAEILRTQLNLTDAQVTRLRETQVKFRDRRQAINQEEGQVRTSMRELLCSTDTTRSADVSRALDQLSDLQKRRMQLFDDEQRDLATFMTPYQRARYIGAQEMVQNRIGPPGGGGRGAGRIGGPPPGGGPPIEGGRAMRGAGRGDRQGPPPDGGMRRGGPPPIPPGCGEAPPPAP